jgi:hypothetical protein
MADEKSIVYNVDIQFGELQKNQEEIKKRISDLREEQSKLDVSTKENQKAFRDNNAQLKALEGQYKLNEKSIGELSNAEKANTDTTNFNNNSIKQNRELLKELNAEYIRLQKPTKEQTDRLKNLTDTLKAQESAVGNNVRNVGNYKEAFASAADGIKVFGTGLGSLFKMILTNPVGVILLAFTTLFSVLQKFEPIFDFFERALAGIDGAITGALGSINKLLSLDFSGFMDGISSAASESYKLAEAIQELEDRERAFGIESAKSEAKIKNLIIQSKDRTKTEQERLGFLNEASNIEKKNFEESLAIAKESFRIAQSQLKIAEKNFQANDELRNKAAEAEKNLINISSSSADLQEKITNRKNLLIQTENEERQKLADKNKARLEKQRADEEKAIAKAAKQLEDFTKKVTEQLNAEQKARVDAFNNNKVINELNRAQFEANLKQQFADGLLTRKQYDDALKQSQIDRNNEEIARLEQYNGITGAYDDQITALKIANQNLVTDNKIANDDKQKQLDEQNLQYELELAQIQATDLEAKNAAEVAIIENKNAQILADTTKTEEQKKTEIAKNNAAIVQIERATAQARVDALASVGNSLMALSEIIGKSTIEGKALAIASTIISTLTSAQNIYESTSKIPFVGSILAPINAGIALLQGYQRVRALTAVQVPQFAEGGLVEGFANGGLSGTRISAGMGMPIRRKNGDNMLATIKTGEVILNQRQQNALGGSNTFKRIGVPGFANGGMITPDAAIDSSINMAEALRGLQLVVSATEITEVQNRLKVIETTTSL